MFGIYVHIPFCVHRCSYCDFYSSTQYGVEPFRRIAEKIRWEAQAASQWLATERLLRPVSSIFFGGGTPSLLPMEHLEALFSTLRCCYGLVEGAEITLEANPETVTSAFATELLSRTPVNRVSLGAQSFQPKHLKTLERLGSPESIRRAVKTLRGAGLNNYSLDLIFGIPGQTKEELLADIEEAVSLEPGHLSFYSLTLKPGHKLHKLLPTDDAAAEMYEAGRARLLEHGYEAYEISNFCRPFRESKHNMLYWSGGDFLGLGPSAATRFYWDGCFHHRKQVSSWEQYLKVESFPFPDFDVTNSFQTVLEATFLELRKRTGVDLALFRERYGYDLQSATTYPLYRKEGLLEVESGRLRLSSKGWLLAEGIAEGLVEARS